MSLFFPQHLDRTGRTWWVPWNSTQPITFMLHMCTATLGVVWLPSILSRLFKDILLLQTHYCLLPYMAGVGLRGNSGTGGDAILANFGRGYKYLQCPSCLAIAVIPFALCIIWSCWYMITDVICKIYFTLFIDACGNLRLAGIKLVCVCSWSTLGAPRVLP